MNVDEAQEILRKIISKAHTDAEHDGALSQFKSIIGLQRTSIGMFLDSILEQFRAYADPAAYSKAKQIIKVDLRDADPEIWKNYQSGGDYPPEFDILGNHIMETLIERQR
tara:strand:+ start:559 stop:888 length:330 start_codon:yes stop_codon:yes gene_type:complete